MDCPGRKRWSRALDAGAVSPAPRLPPETADRRGEARRVVAWGGAGSPQRSNPGRSVARHGEEGSRQPRGRAGERDVSRQSRAQLVREQTRETRRQNRLDKRHEKRIVVGVDIPTKDELRALLEHAHGRYRALIVTAIFTGLRASELRGLQWGDVDLDAGELTVRQRADRWGSIGSPKSDAGKREVPLAPMVVNALREWQLACPSGAADLVFPNTKGNVDSLPNMHRRGLGAVQWSAGITADPNHPKYGLHALRHAAASLFIEQGFSPKRVQALMGHSSIQVTFDTYGHLFPAADDDRVAMGQLQARLVG
jgi:integrase